MSPNTSKGSSYGDCTRYINLLTNRVCRNAPHIAAYRSRMGRDRSQNFDFLWEEFLRLAKENPDATHIDPDAHGRIRAIMQLFSEQELIPGGMGKVIQACIKKLAENGVRIT